MRYDVRSSAVNDDYIWARAVRRVYHHQQR